MTLVPNIHRLKSWPANYSAVLNGDKRAENRINDRNYLPGDFIALSEFDPALGDGGNYTGRAMLVRITHIIHGGAFGIIAGHCMLSIEVLAVYRQQASPALSAE